VRCSSCGTEFDPAAYQIALPDGSGSFDRVECALRHQQTAAPVPGVRLKAEEEHLLPYLERTVKRRVERAG
jgi:hypothetical protein